MTGLRPVAEIMFSDFFAVCWDIVANEIAKARYMTDGQVTLPAGDPHGQRRRHRASARSTRRASRTGRMAVPGLKVVAPSTPADMKGLLAAAIRDADPVRLLRAQGPVRGEGRGPRRRARRAARRGRRGPRRAATSRSSRWRRWCRGALEAAEQLAADGHRRDGHRPALPRAAGHADDPRSSPRDRPALHRRGEPAALRLGRRDRLDRGRGAASTTLEGPIVRITDARTCRCRRPRTSRRS